MSNRFLPYDEGDGCLISTPNSNPSPDSRGEPWRRFDKRKHFYVHESDLFPPSYTPSRGSEDMTALREAGDGEERAVRSAAER